MENLTQSHAALDAVTSGQSELKVYSRVVGTVVPSLVGGMEPRQFDAQSVVCQPESALLLEEKSCLSQAGCNQDCLCPFRLIPEGTTYCNCVMYTSRAHIHQD